MYTHTHTHIHTNTHTRTHTHTQTHSVSVEVSYKFRGTLFCRGFLKVSWNVFLSISFVFPTSCPTFPFCVFFFAIPLLFSDWLPPAIGWPMRFNLMFYWPSLWFCLAFSIVCSQGLTTGFPTHVLTVSQYVF